MNCGTLPYATKVCLAGYRWEEVVNEGKSLLVLREEDTAPTETETPYRYYKPMCFPDLFKHFSRLDTAKPKQALVFANKYGPLGIYHFRRDTAKQVGIQMPLTDLLDNNLPPPPRGDILDSWELWQRAIYDMRRIIELWELASHKPDRATLHKRIGRKDWNQLMSYQSLAGHSGGSPEPYIYYDNDSDASSLTKQIIAFSSNDPHFFENTDPISRVNPALLHVKKTTNSYLEEFVEATVETKSEKYDGLEFGLCPNNLIGALWLQFALFINGTLETAECKQCRKSFKPSRRGHVYCSEACRIRHHRTVSSAPMDESSITGDISPIRMLNVMEDATYNPTPKQHRSSETYSTGMLPVVTRSET